MMMFAVRGIRFPGAAFIALAATLVSGCESNGPTRPSGEGWVIEAVASGNQIGVYGSLTTTTDGTVHLAYHDAYRERLYHAHRIGPDQWIHTRLDTVGRFGRFVVIRSDPGDTLHIAYQDNYHLDLRYARYDGSSWEYERFQPSTSYGGTPRLLVRPESLHLLEMNNDSNRINYWQGSLSNWVWAGSIDVYRPTIRSFSFTLGPYGPAVATYEERYGRGTTLALKTATAPTETWSSTIVTIVDGPSSPPVLEYDGDGELHILYQDAGMVLHDTARGIVDVGLGIGLIRLHKGPGQYGGLWVLYPVEDGLALGYCPRNGDWSRVTGIIDLDPYGQYDLHVAQDGTVHICVYCEQAQQFYYGQWEGIP